MIRQLNTAFLETGRITQARRQRSSKDTPDPTVQMMLHSHTQGRGDGRHKGSQELSGMSSRRQVDSHLGSALLITCNEQKHSTENKC